MSPEKELRPAPEPAAVRMTPIAAIGTLLWTVALVVTQLFRSELGESGREWWVACAASGVALGILGTAMMVVMDRRRFGSQRTSDPSSS